MPYSEALADRIRDALGPRADLTERKMFGGIAFMLGGHVACGVIGDDLLVRLGPDGERALAEPHTPTPNPSRQSRGEKRSRWRLGLAMREECAKSDVLLARSPDP